MQTNETIESHITGTKEINNMQKHIEKMFTFDDL